MHLIEEKWCVANDSLPNATPSQFWVPIIGLALDFLPSRRLGLGVVAHLKTPWVLRRKKWCTASECHSAQIFGPGYWLSA